MSKQLVVISPAYFLDLAPCHLLIESCRYFGLNLHLYGKGEPWPWLFDAKVVQLMREIEKLDNKYILVSDGDDAFFLAKEEEIIDKFLTSKASILVSADRQQEEGDSRWPQSIFRDLYPKSPTPWRYCNSGGYIGTKTSLLHLLHVMANLKQPDYIPIWRSKDWSNDQFCMSVAYLNGFPLTVDIKCEVFQTMGCVEEGEVEYESGRLVNTITETYPCVVHFNGNAPGIREAYKQCFAPTTIQ